MKCRSCTKEIDEDSRFCKLCGCPIQGSHEYKILPTLFTQITDELRARREAEHIYTAAAIGSFGAVAWGVATLAVNHAAHVPCFLLHPAIVAAIGVFLLAVVVSVKISVEHLKYKDLMKELGKTSLSILRVYNLPPGYLPEGLTAGKAGRGYAWSIAIVAAGALLAIGFSLSVWRYSG